MQRKDGKSKNYGEDICEICGKIYTKKGSTAKYCTKCRAVKLKNYQAFKQRRKQANPIFKKFRAFLRTEFLKINREKYFEVFGNTCSICGRELSKTNWSRHHTDYKKNLIVIVCRGCHSWLHGRQSYNKILYDKFGKDKAPLEFAKRIIKVYKKAKPLLGTVNTKQDFVQWKKDNGYE